MRLRSRGHVATVSPNPVPRISRVTRIGGAWRKAVHTASPCARIVGPIVTRNAGIAAKISTRPLIRLIRVIRGSATLSFISAAGLKPRNQSRTTDRTDRTDIWGFGGGKQGAPRCRAPRGIRRIVASNAGTAAVAGQGHGRPYLSV